MYDDHKTAHDRLSTRNARTNRTHTIVALIALTLAFLMTTHADHIALLAGIIH